MLVNITPGDYTEYFRRLTSIMFSSIQNIKISPSGFIYTTYLTSFVPHYLFITPYLPASLGP
jgi:hypothetical protein